MKIPLSWLKEYIPTKLSTTELKEALTSIGLEVEGEDILEIALTPNLSHCASVRGIARELSALTQESLTIPQFSLAELGQYPIQEQIKVSVAAPSLCPRYACRLITEVRVGPSPEWLQKRLQACGMRGVNNVVDITNLVLLELGHPLHAFDYALLEGKEIIVRKAKKAEKITALDGKEYYPTEETLVIADAKKAVAIAGIMGSSNSEVSHESTSILLESAYFEPTAIRRAAKQLSLSSDASHRFERGTDPNGILESLDRAAHLIAEMTGGKIAPGTLDIQSAPLLPKTLSCRLSRVNRLLGTHLAMSEIEAIFRSLNCEIDQIKDDVITIKAPTYRCDLLQEIDLIEEVARLYGYNNLHKKEKPLFRLGNIGHSPEYLFAKKVRGLLINEGLQELLTCDLIGPELVSLMATDNFPSRSQIKLLNPHSTAQSIMRPSMLPGILNAVKYNADHDTHSMSAFEVGRVHFTSKDRYFEPPAVAIVLTGNQNPPHWEKKAETIDFFDLKGIIENLLKGLKIQEAISFNQSHFANFHPTRQAVIQVGNVEVGIMGEIHPSTLKLAGLERAVYFAELNLEDLQRLITVLTKMTPLPLFPASIRDFTITVQEDVQAGSILKWIHEVKSELLESYSLINVYRGENLEKELKNLTFRFVYRDPNKTISLSAVENEHVRITQTIYEHLQRKPT